MSVVLVTLVASGALGAIGAGPAVADTCVNTVSGLWGGNYGGSFAGAWHADYQFSSTTAPDTATGTFDGGGIGGPLTATVTCAGVFDVTSGALTYHGSIDSATQTTSGTWQYGQYSGGLSGGLLAPTVTGLDPADGSTLGGDSVTISGTNFNSASDVEFGTTPASTFTVDSDTQITATVPAHDPGVVDVTVTGIGGMSDTNDADGASDRFTYALPVPVVTAVSPRVGDPAGGTSVTITGSRLSGATGVFFGAGAAASFVVNSDTSIVATSPAGAGTVDVTVQNAFGANTTSPADRFVYGSGYPSVVLSHNPIAYWRLGERSDNSVAADSSGNGRDGVYDRCVGRGARGAISGDSDTAASFLADDCGVTFTPRGSDGYSGDFTAEAWVNPTADTTKPWYTLISSRFPEESPGASEFSFDLKLTSADAPNGKQLFVDIGDGSQWMLVDGVNFDWQPGHWYDVAVSVDAANGVATFYVNGQAIGTRSFEPTNALLYDPAHPIEIGQNKRYVGFPNPEYFDGTIDEVALYPGVLSDSALLNDYQAGAAPSATVPDAPTIGAATAGNGSASVTFTAPTNDGGSAITGYDASCTSSDGGALGSASGSASPIVVGGLTNGNTYTCRVTATNTAGNSDPSARSNGFIPTWCTTGHCVSVGDRSMLEGDSGTHAMTFPVTLSQPATSPVAVHYAVTGITATGGSKAGTGIDFKVASGTVTFNPNAKTGLTPISGKVTVTIYGDTTTETDQTFAVTLSSPTGGYALGRNAGTGTILNDDGTASGITIGVGDASIVTTANGMQNLALAVTLSAKATSTVSVNYTITAGTASYSLKVTGGGDYGGKTSGTLAFAAGSTLKTINIPIWPNAQPDTNEAFTITLSGLNGTGVTLTRTTGTAAILD